MEATNKSILYLLSKIFNLSRQSINERLRLQKLVYLLQASGVKLGYGFSWYKYGPYSQELVQDSYEVLESSKDRYEEETSDWQFSKESEDKFNEFKNILADSIDNPEKLELIASVSFVKNVWHSDAQKEDFPEIFKKYKIKYFDGEIITDNHIKVAYDISNEIRSCNEQ